MQIFEYPYVIITILIFIFILMGITGLYFTMKSVKTSKGTLEKGFSGIGKIENDFEKAGNLRKNRCLLYVSVSMDSLKRLHSEAKAMRIFELIKNAMLTCFCSGNDRNISMYGKNNFLAFCDMDCDAIIRCIERCADEVNRIFLSQQVVNTVDINFGYYCSAAAGVSFKTALERAKQACSIAEDRGVLYYRWDNLDVKEFERKLKIENNIQHEIDNNRFFLEYQPVIDAKTNKIMGAEVLSRLNSSTEGILTPYHFLSAVNNVGLNEKFDYYIFEKNCKWISNDMDNRVKYVYTINFSRQTLCDENLADNIINIIEKYGVDYSCIAIEILEDKNLDDVQRALMIKNLRLLKERGILILLDDFGKGYTSFVDLAEFNIDIVKIDKTITRNSVNDTGFLILKNIIKTAHDLGFKTLCEGIETKEHKKRAVDAGCDILQGYYFYRPMPVTQLETLF